MSLVSSAEAQKGSDTEMGTIQLTLGPAVQINAVAGHTPEQAYMNKAFALVSPEFWGKADWRSAISAVLTNADLEAVGVSLADVADAIEFFTATKASVTYSSTLGGEPVYIVRAAGFRNGPAR